MYRTFLSTALVAMLFLTGCGGSDSAGKGKGNSGGGKSAGASAKSTLPVDQQSEIGLEINIGQLLKDEAAKAMLESTPDVPPFVKSMSNLSVYVALPANMGLASDPNNFDFYASLSFSSADDCKAAFDEMFKNGFAEDVKKNDKDFKKVASPGSPVIYVRQDGSSIQVFSEKYVDSGATSFATEGLRAALNGDPQGEPFKLAIDVEGANDFLAALGAMAPQAEAFVKSKSIVLAGGGTGELVFMMAVETPDEETAKKVKSTVQAGVGMLALAAATQLPPEDVAPATNEFINYLMQNLKPEIDGNTVKVVINKPENYDDLKKKMGAEAKKLQEQMLGGPGGGLKGDEKFDEKFDDGFDEKSDDKSDK